MFSQNYFLKILSSIKIPVRLLLKVDNLLSLGKPEYLTWRNERLVNTSDLDVSNS